MDYANIKRGYREDIVDKNGKKIFLRSSSEANVYRYFRWLKEIKEIYNFEYEPMTFWFKNVSEIRHLDLTKHTGLTKGKGILRGVVSYLIDFKVYDTPEKHHWIEVKGYMDKESLTKINRFRKYYPNEELRVFDSNVCKELDRKVGRIIPNWEFSEKKQKPSRIRFSKKKR